VKQPHRIKPLLEKPILWMGSSLDDLSRFPSRAKRIAGYALRLAQRNERHIDAKPMHGVFADVVEIVARDGFRRTSRVMYVVQFPGVVYVLHAFNKKATQGIKTPHLDLETLGIRLKAAKRDYEEHYGNTKTP
jgi:phage-related protein